jgi:hypothetical protein
VSPGARRVRSGGLEIYDAARLSHGFAPTGEILFELFGPDNATCAGEPIFTSPTAVNGNGVYNSDRFSVTESGTYRWVAIFSGDANNHRVATLCGAQHEHRFGCHPAHQFARAIPPSRTRRPFMATATTCRGPSLQSHRASTDG